MKCCNKNLEEKIGSEREGFEKKVYAECPDCKTVYFKKLNSKALYSSKNNKDWTCTSCGSDIMGISVTHSVWDPNFSCGGGGSTVQELVPYCPKCEKKPDSNGSPVYESIRDLI